MNSLILRVGIRFVMPLLLLFSIFLLWRGHNQPGGGFAGGLVAAAAFALYSLSYDASTAQRVLRIRPAWLIALGLLLALFSGLIALFNGLPFMTGLWGYLPIPWAGKLELGTPFLFDIGVYLLVIGITLMFVFSLEEAE